MGWREDRSGDAPVRAHGRVSPADLAERAEQRAKPLADEAKPPQLCLLEMFAVVSMLLSVTTDATSLHEGVADGIQNIVRVLDQVIIFAHAIVLTALFGLSEEVNGPLWSRLRRCLAAILVGNSEAEITAFPRSASGFWG